LKYLVERMALRREDQFACVVSSDGCKDAYPGNKANNFRILFKDPIDLCGEEDWEVGLLDMHYPYSWLNIGPKAGSRMAYNVKGKVYEVNFQNWQCESLNDLIVYLKKQMPDEYEIGVDDVGRFMMSRKDGNICEVGFSEELMRVLGLRGRGDQWNELHVDTFLVRQELRVEFGKFLSTKDIFEKNKDLFDELVGVSDPYKMIEVIREYIDEAEVSTYGGVKQIPEFQKKLGVEIDEYFNAICTELMVNRTETVRRNVHILLRNLKEFCERDVPPVIIRGIGPGIMNPIEQMYVHTNIIQPMDVNDQSWNLLKIINTRGEGYKSTADVFMHPTYQPVVKGGKISMIHVYITRKNGENVPFQSGSVLMTLHFRKQRYRK
jgi:hypothetical protein